MIKTIVYCDMCRAFIDVSAGKTIPAIMHTDKAISELCQSCGAKVQMFIEAYQK